MGRLIGLHSIGGIFRFIIAVLIVAPGIVLAIVSYVEFRDEKEHMAGHMRQVITMQNEIVTEWFEDHANQVRGIARLNFVRAADRQSMDYNFREILQSDPDFNSLTFVNKDGISEPQYNQPRAHDVSDRDYFKAALRGQDYISDVIVGRSSGKPIVIISSPVYGFDGSFQGVLFGSVQISTIAKLLEDFKIGSTGKVYLVNGKGQIISHARPADEQHLSADSLREMPSVDSEGIRLALEGKPGTSIYEDYRGVKVMGVYHPVKVKDLAGAMLAEIEMSEVLQPFYRQLVVVMALYFVILLVAVPLAYWMVKRIRQPVELLTRGAYHVRQSDYDYIIPEDAIGKAPQELRLLCEIFNRMIVEIRNSVNVLNETNKKLQHVSLHDALTGLCNRACFDSALRRLGKAATVPVGILVCDIDGLKVVNDVLGHQAGDELIRAAAQTLKKGVRDSDAVARIGGDEFAILLPGAGPDRMEAVCRRIGETAKLHNSVKPGLPLYLSFGYAVRYVPNFSTDEFFREADNNMYRMKEAQRQTVRDKIDAAVKTAGMAGAEASARVKDLA